MFGENRRRFPAKAQSHKGNSVDRLPSLRVSRSSKTVPLIVPYLLQTNSNKDSKAMKIHNNFRVSALSIVLLFLMQVVSLGPGSSAKQPTSSPAEASNYRDVTLTTTESIKSKPEVLFDDFSY